MKEDQGINGPHDKIFNYSWRQKHHKCLSVKQRQAQRIKQYITNQAHNKVGGKYSPQT